MIWAEVCFLKGIPQDFTLCTERKAPGGTSARLGLQIFLRNPVIPFLHIPCVCDNCLETDIFARKMTNLQNNKNYTLSNKTAVHFSHMIVTLGHLDQWESG